VADMTGSPDPKHSGSPPPETRQDPIALKYLELARAEILERIKLRYQILIAYAGAVGAVALWAYPNPVASTPGGAVADTSVRDARLVLAGVVVAFLAVVANWIFYHNERMVNGLAEYQAGELAQHLHFSSGVKPWELSDELGDTDPQKHVFWDIWAQGALVVAPAVIGWVPQWTVQNSHIPMWVIWISRIASIVLTWVAFFLADTTYRGRKKLRARLRQLRTKWDATELAEAAHKP